MSAARSPVVPSTPAETATPSAPSSASASSASSAVPPLPLQDQAFLLYCDGLRSPAIAEQLHVAERTVRAWIAADLDESAEVRRLLRHEALERAVTRLQATAQAAWDAFERVADADDRVSPTISSSLPLPRAPFRRRPASRRSAPATSPWRWPPSASSLVSSTSLTSPWTTRPPSPMPPRP